jgi:anthranilate synthase/aminodeoxychorismate synthase-like glutamine amidotransferase
VTRVLVIDNYDSFTYNLVQYLGELGVEPIVVRNDAITIDEARALSPDGVLLSPGPGRPEDAGMLCAAITAFAGVVPVLGVCLGHQAIGQVYGGNVVGAPHLVHGKTSPISHNNEGVFVGLPNPLSATRYHSLIIMGVRHKSLDVEGVQFHPESILTTCGHDLLRNFVARCTTKA